MYTALPTSDGTNYPTPELLILTPSPRTAAPTPILTTTTLSPSVPPSLFYIISPSQPSTIELKPHSPAEKPTKIIPEKLSSGSGLSSGAIASVIIFGTVFGLLCGCLAYRIRVEILIRRSHALEESVSFDMPKTPPAKAFEFSFSQNFAAQKSIDENSIDGVGEQNDFFDII